MNILTLNKFLSTLNFVLFFVGYQLVTSLFLPISADIEGISRTVTVPYRGISLLLSIIVILLNLKYKLKYQHPALSVLIFFWLILIVRMFYDIYINPSIKISGSFQLWMYVFGICLPAVFSVIRSINMIDYNKAFNWALSLTMFTIVLTLFSNQLIFISSGELSVRQEGNLALNTISYGHLGAMGIILSLFALTKNRSAHFKKLLLIAFVVISTYTMLRAGSRGPVAAFVFVLMFWLFATGKNLLTGSLIFIGTALIIFVYFDQILSLLGHISPVIELRLRASIYEGDTSNRNLLYMEAIQLFKDNPLWGSRFSLKNNYGEIIYSHNILLDAFMGLGIIGGFSMLYFLIIALKKCYYLINEKEPVFWVNLILLQQISGSMFSGAFYYNQLLSALLTFVFIYKTRKL